MKKFLKYFGVVIYVILFIGVSGKLFFETQFDSAWNRLAGLVQISRAQSLTIGYFNPILSLNPLAYDTGSRARLLHVYEPLVRRNADLQIEPALAVSYGALDDLTWEFRLRDGVSFHNGTPLTMDDVIYSLKKGKEDPSSGVRDLASTITSIDKVDEKILHIKTEAPDPLLLQELSSFLIFPKSASSGQVVGTGPYEFVEQNNDILKLKRFENYWGELPKVPEVTLLTLKTRDEKLAALESKSVDILKSVPQDAAKNFSFPGFSLVTVPSLEVNFLMFNMDKTFKSGDLRKAVYYALDSRELSKMAQGFASPAAQFVGKGIFGYDPTILPPEIDLKKAEEFAKKASGFFRVQATLDLPKGLESLGLNVKETLRGIGIDVNLNFLAPTELEKKIQSKQSEFFFFGWSSDLGDASDFLSAVVHSPSGKFGNYNGANYRSTEVDQIIEFGQQTVNQEKRLEKIRTVMKKITTEDIIGIPLFSPEVLYAVSSNVKWTPRVDGYILAQEIE